MCRGFLLHTMPYIVEDFAGDSPGGFFWAPFPTKIRRKNPATKSTKKSGCPKTKICEKTVLPKTDPDIFLPYLGAKRFPKPEPEHGVVETVFPGTERELEEPTAATFLQEPETCLSDKLLQCSTETAPF